MNLLDKVKKPTEEYAPLLTHAELSAIPTAPTATMIAADRTLMPGYQSQPTSMLEIIYKLSTDPSANVEIMSLLLAEKARQDAKEAEKAYGDAMRRLQAKLPKVTKDGKIDLGGNKGSIAFATFEHIMEVVSPLLRDEGFSVTFGSEAAASGVLVTCTLAHQQGHSRTEKMQLAADTSGAKNSVQGMGSSLSYARRYLFTGMVNLVIAGIDDNAKSACPISDEQHMKLDGMLQALGEATGLDERARLKAHLKVNKLAEIPRDSFTEVLVKVQGKMKEKGL